MNSSIVTQDELSLVKSYLLLLFIEKIFERDSHILEDSGVLKTPSLYVEMVNAGADRTGILLSEIKHEFKKRSMRVYDVRQDDTGVHASYISRGTNGEISIENSPFRREMYERMRAYLGLKTSLPMTAAFPVSPDTSSHATPAVIPTQPVRYVRKSNIPARYKSFRHHTAVGHGRA